MTAEDLRKQYEYKLKELQESCSHDKTTEMMSSWAPGHYGGMVKVCDVCEKVIE